MRNYRVIISQIAFLEDIVVIEADSEEQALEDIRAAIEEGWIHLREVSREPPTVDAIEPTNSPTTVDLW